MTILQKTLPFTPWADPRMRRLPGIQPLDPATWLMVDDAYADQMALRDHLLTTQRDAVHGLDACGRPAAQETLETVLDHLRARDDFRVGQDSVQRPDGVSVPLDRTQPLVTAGRLVQEDLCLMEKPGGDEHLLTGAVLCFPAGWTLAEKLMRPMLRIHLPVSDYSDDLARRVQRLLDGIRPGRPLWRANVHYASDPTLFSPRSETTPRDADSGQAAYIRSERQCLLRLPRSGGVLFSIHTFMVETSSLPPEQALSLQQHPIGHEAARAAV